MILEAVLDAGPLFSALVSNFNVLDIDRGRLMRCANALDSSLRSEEAQRTLLRVLGTIPKKFTTSHAIGELQGLQSSRLRLFGEDLVSSWQASIDLLKQWQVDEELIRLLDLASDEDLRPACPELVRPILVS